MAQGASPVRACLPQPVRALRAWSGLKGRASAWVLACVALTLCCALLCILDGDYYVSRKVVFVGFSAFAFGGVACLFAVGARTAWRPECCFLVVYALLGVVTLVLVPAYSTPDTPSHVHRAYEISRGDLVTRIDPVTKTGTLPSVFGEIYDGNPELRFVIGNLSLRIDPSSRASYSYLNTSLYAPVSYLPSALAMAAVGLVSDSVWAHLYAARLANLLVAGALLYWAIRCAPYGKLALALSALLPMALELYPTTSPDCLVVACASALLAYVCRLREERGALRANVATLALLTAALALAKVVYLPVCLLVLLVPDEAFGSRRRRVAMVGALALVVTAMSLGWLAFVSSILADYPSSRADPPAQLRFVLADPLGFLVILARTVITRGGTWLSQLVGSSLNNLDVHPVELFTQALACLGVGGVALASVGGRRVVDGSTRALMAAVALLTLLASLSSLYLQWNAVANPVVEGFQGRYLIPLLPMALLALVPCERAWEARGLWVGWYCVTLLVFLAPIEVAL